MPNATATAWRRSSFCAATTCVEVKHYPDRTEVRDSKRVAERPQVYTPEEWTAFLDGVKAGEFDRPQADQDRGAAQ